MNRGQTDTGRDRSRYRQHIEQEHYSAVHETTMRAESSRPRTLEKNAMRQIEDTKTKNLTNQLTTLNAQILQAEEAGFPDQIAPHLHENFTIIRASGKKENRQAFLDAVPANANR